MVDGHYFSRVGSAKVKQIIKKTRRGLNDAPNTDASVFPISVCCPRCNHGLMDSKHPIDNHPSVKMTVSFDRKHGWLRLSSLYGSYTLESEYDIPINTIVNVFCPHCHAELVSESSCLSCGAPLIPMIVLGGGMIQICSRIGCKAHMLDVEGTNF
jgi:hypothetical protein